MEFVGKKYKLESSEKFDEYMKALGETFFPILKYFGFQQHEEKKSATFTESMSNNIENMKIVAA